MYNEQTDVCFCTAGGAGDVAPTKKRPLAPAPAPCVDGGVTQNFRPKASQRHSVITSKRCPDCDNGFIREPDGYGCVQWTSCYSCGGTGEADD